MAEERKKEATLDLESLTTRQFISAFTKELEGYRDTFGQLMITDAFAKAAHDISQIVYHKSNDIMTYENTAGLRKLYKELQNFEKKYAFLEQDLSKRALELKYIAEFLQERA